MIKSIYLENWKTHLESKLNFKKGANILIGIIGSGKSSVVDAICYALYGTYPSLSNRKISLDETIMFKPNKKDFFKVTLELEHEDKLYLIEREVYSGNKSNSAKVYLDGKLISGPKKTDVDDFISKLLGIDYNLFIKVVYSSQNEIDYFLKIAPSKRKEQFDDLFGISHFEKIKIATRDIDRGLSTELNKKDALLTQILEQLSQVNLIDLLEKEKTTKVSLDQVNDQILSLNLKIKTVYENLNNLKQIKLKFDKVNLDYNSYSSRLSEIIAELSSYADSFTEESLIKDKDKLILLDVEYKKKQEDNNKLILTKKELENKIKFYVSEIKGNESKLIILNNSLVNEEYSFNQLITLKEAKQKEIDALKDAKLFCLSKIKELDPSIFELSKGFSKCPVCDTDLSKDKVDSLLISKKQELEKANLESKNIVEKISISQKELDNLILKEKFIEKNKIIQNQILEIKKSISYQNDLLLSFEKEVSLIPVLVNLDELNNSIKHLKENILKKEEYLKLFLKKKELELKVSSLKEDLADINYNEDDYLKILSEYNNFDSLLKNLNEKSKIYSDVLLNINSQITNYNSLNLKKEELLKSKSNISNKKQNLSYFLKAIDVSQFQLRKILIDNINQALSIIWPKIYPYKDYLSARLNTNNDYILEVLTIKKEWIRVEGLLSGGERACASLSIRIAISLILTKKLGLLILDEPTHNLDESSVDALSIILDDELPDLVDQIFIVTHDQKLLETLNSNKFIIERDKENDGVSKVVF